MLLRSKYSNCLHNSAVSIKLNLLLAMMRFLYVVELARGRVFWMDSLNDILFWSGKYAVLLTAKLHFKIK